MATTSSPSPLLGSASRATADAHLVRLAESAARAAARVPDPHTQQAIGFILELFVGLMRKAPQCGQAEEGRCSPSSLSVSWLSDGGTSFRIATEDSFSLLSELPGCGKSAPEPASADLPRCTPPALRLCATRAGRPEERPGDVATQARDSSELGRSAFCGVAFGGSSAAPARMPRAATSSPPPRDDAPQAWCSNQPDARSARTSSPSAVNSCRSEAPAAPQTCGHLGLSGEASTAPELPGHSERVAEEPRVGGGGGKLLGATSPVPFGVEGPAHGSATPRGRGAATLLARGCRVAGRHSRDIGKRHGAATIGELPTAASAWKRTEERPTSSSAPRVRLGLGNVSQKAKEDTLRELQRLVESVDGESSEACRQTLPRRGAPTSLARASSGSLPTSGFTAATVGDLPLWLRPGFAER